MLITQERLSKHNIEMGRAGAGMKITDIKGRPIELITGMNTLIKQLKHNHSIGGTLFFIGNGGSSAIASHMAVDYTKNGGVRAQAFNDASLLTCFGNDYGYEKMFEAALEVYARKGDILFAISSSGESKNIINGVNKAKSMGCPTVTFSAFSAVNTLRRIGDKNFYVPCEKGQYGIAEVTHLSIIHTILDFICEDK